MNKIYKNYIFDLDGTLADTSEDIVNCIKESLAQFDGYPVTQISSDLIGPPIKEIGEKLLPKLTQEQLSAFTKGFRRCYDGSDFPTTKMMAGARDTLNTLKQRGDGLFIATNKPVSATRDILNKLQIDDYFHDSISPDSQNERLLTKSEMIISIINNHNLIPSETVMIGDLESDITAAHVAGVDSIAFLGGYGKKQTLLDAKPSYVVSKLEEIVALS